jgi:glycerol-3-phosphate dehydrogenase subunit C
MAENKGISRMSDSKVALFHGCFANYFHPEIGRSIVALLERKHVEVAIPEQRCCGLPMLARGNSGGLNRSILHNTRWMTEVINQGYVVVTTCSSCYLFIRRHYPLVQGPEGRSGAPKLVHYSEYLLNMISAPELANGPHADETPITYHAPCHLRAADIGQPSETLLRRTPGTTIAHVSELCCGLGGSFGMEKGTYAMAQQISAPLVRDISAHPSDLVLTDCGGCQLQIQKICGVPTEHPAVFLRDRLW